ncbi:Glycosyltransferase family 9 (heptosyltransferase) [Rhizobiales bacterium GAS188]|nr:Glycosyltransferase family 9 (heptosyltransferase) [Rhizobiales bacterium GAS188]
MTRPAQLSIKRTHGLGNLIMLLPVIDRLTESGIAVHLVTRPEWVEAISPGRRAVDFDETPRGDTIDLDAATLKLIPGAHRTLEFAHLLNIQGPFSPPRLSVPKAWSHPFRRYAGALIVAPESGHPARSWPVARLQALATLLAAEPVVLTGLHPTPALPCRADLRGQLSLPQLLGLLEHARAVLCFDSGMLHLALARSVPTLAIFGGIDPTYRIFPEQRARVIQAALDCCPCNKAETCRGRYPCLTELTSAQVAEELASIDQVVTREIRRIEMPACVS